MRRPVLPSSGQAYDEVNIARFSAAGKSQCPVSGAPLECHRRGPSKGKVMLTPDYALRNVIRHQAQQAKVCTLPCFGKCLESCISAKAYVKPFLAGPAHPLCNTSEGPALPAFRFTWSSRSLRCQDHQC